jgi:hypothetical protein
MLKLKSNEVLYMDPNTNPQPGVTPPVTPEPIQPAAPPPVQSPAPVPNPVAAAPAPEASLPSVPDNWPGTFGLYQYSKQAVKVNIGAIVILWILQAIISGSSFKLHQTGDLLSLIIGSLLTTAAILLYLAGINRQKLSLGQALSQAVPLWLKMIGLNILLFLSFIVSFILLIVPFFFVAPRLSLANYFLVDKNMGILEAYKTSWSVMKGHSGKAWGIILLTIAIILLSLTIIGIPFSIYMYIMYSAAFAVLYKFLEKGQPEPAANPTPSQVAAPPAPDAQPPVTPTQPEVTPPSPPVV